MLLAGAAEFVVASLAIFLYLVHTGWFACLKRGFMCL